MEMHDDRHMPLPNYANGSVATTWTISFKAVRQRNWAAANLLLLWAHLDNKNLWHGLLARSSPKSDLAEWRTADWLGEIAYSESAFMNAIRILRSYSLVEEAEGQTGYATHPVVHQWAFHIQDDSQRTALSWLAVVLVGLAVPLGLGMNHWEIQRRLLPHAEQCEKDVITNGLALQGVKWEDDEEAESKKTLHVAVVGLGNLYSHHEMPNKAEKMYMLVLGNKEKLPTESSTSILAAACNLGSLYQEQKKFSESEKIFSEALEGTKRMYGEDHKETFHTIRSIGVLYSEQGKFDKAEEMCIQALNGFKRLLGDHHPDTLGSLHNIGMVYLKQEKLGKAEKIFVQLLEDTTKMSAEYDPITTMTANALGKVFLAQEKFEQAKEVYTLALGQFERAIGPKDILTYVPALWIMWSLGSICGELNSLEEASEWYSRALSGYENCFGEEDERCQTLRKNLADLDKREKDRNSNRLRGKGGAMKANNPDGIAPDSVDQNDQSTRRKGWSRRLGERIFRKSHK